MTTIAEAPQLCATRVGDVMHRGVFTCRAQASALTAARVMAAHRVHSVVVVDDDGACTGVVTEADIAAAAHRGTLGSRASAVAAAPVYVDPRDTILHAAQLLHEHERSHAVVVEPQTKRPLGVLSVLDIVDVLAEGG